MKESPLFWPAYFKGSALFVLDETLIPAKTKYIQVSSVQQAVDVIRKMKTRAFGQFLVVLNVFLLVLKESRALSQQELFNRIKRAAEALNKSRPTFPFSEVTSIVVGWAQQALAEGNDIRALVNRNIQGYLEGIRFQRLDRVRRIAQSIKDGDSVLTHCNVSGELAMAAGLCREQKKKVRFFATETRPYFQGAKLTCWELQKAGAEVTLVADNAVGSLFADGLVDKVIVGSDRSCANGDIANKIGTYQIGVLAKEFGVPMLALTQPSNKVKKGDDMPIEERDPQEFLKFKGKRIISGKIQGFYPGFDVIPNNLITKAIAINAR